MVQRRLLNIVRSYVFSVLIDGVVVANVLVVGLDCDLGDQAPVIFAALRHTICGLYLIEMGLRVAAEDKQFFFSPMNLYELLLVLLALIDIWILQRTTWLWMSTIARSVRLLRIWKVAESFPALHDLWLVLTGLARAGRSLVWLALLVAAVLYACGSAITGLMRDSEGEGAESCQGPSMDCIDQQEYFGSVQRSALTLLQLATLDSWASHVVRPLSVAHPVQAVILVLFVLAAAYALLSVAVGVLVWSTVSLARSHESHVEHQHQLETKETIRLLTNYLKAGLAIEDRTTIDLKELVDAMSVTAFAQAFKELELPVSTISELFLHLDHTGSGEITIDEFEAGITKMKSSSSRFDVAILTATVGGASTFVNTMDGRTETVLEDLQSVRQKLSGAFAELRELALHEVQQVPEVRLRAMGCIRSAAADAMPVSRPRFTS